MIPQSSISIALACHRELSVPCTCVDSVTKYVVSFIREDETYNYISGRFPPDADLLAQKSIELVKSVT